ncbi:gamma-glutamylcyclotransferase [Fulvimarina sp. 2208YS6-2-32]|uniref:glutathione-specific gamma-glutamylcyclotransferase n=1 Tax=Fulvimarina uroteuthidis TaxID=3098149 RepID=A0ABU5HZB0_9HYPH|nr:gamma-glutamylcyclotransferase [Fulvimarina sp. 2208YS6-2-32]MDY8108464.1 gamma-glutamylcyclotransferase [Fulvimarina sp. 2208YS6-2-32]
MSENSDFWVFGYGSLIWNPGFEFVDRTIARLSGFHRSLCVRSHVHRGTPETPGLVFGLDRGGSCVGMAFKVAGARHEETMAYLRARELVTHVYLEKTVSLRFLEGGGTHAVTYVVDRGHQQYAGKISVEAAARIVMNAHGRSGPNVDYVTNALTEIHRMGLRDQWLESVAAHLRR